MLGSLLDKASTKNKTETTFTIPLVAFIQDGELAQFIPGAPAPADELTSEQINSLYTSLVSNFGALQFAD